LTNASPQNGSLDIAAALADPTRHAIYNVLVEAAGDPLAVVDVARQFSLHPNVARMHLQKLTDVGLVQSASRKSDKGGRPARVYRVSERAANLHFPPRDYETLAAVTLRALMELADADPTALDRAGKELGREEGRRALKGGNIDPTTADLDSIVESLRTTCANLGLFPVVEAESDGTIRIEVRNCVFRELSSQYPAHVCRMHGAMLQGLLEEYLSALDFESAPAIFDGSGRACLFKVRLAPSTHGTPKGPALGSARTSSTS
jgi:predicted ArsR family transcriptional regulator